MKNLKKWCGDNLHIDSDIQKIEGYNKKDNFIISEREPGKTTLMWKMIYNAYVNQDRPSILIKRYLNDISESYLEDSANDLTLYYIWIVICILILLIILMLCYLRRRRHIRYSKKKQIESTQYRSL